MLDLIKIHCSEHFSNISVGKEMILFDYESGKYYKLSSVGGHIWELIDASAITISDLCDQLSEYYGLNVDILRPDVVSFVEDLIKLKAVQKL